MKKIVFLLLLIVVRGSSGMAQSYPITPRLDSIRATVLLQLRGASTGTRLLTEPVVNTAINRAVSVTCTRFPALEKFDTVMITSSVEGGALPSDFVRLLQVWRIKGTTKRLPLTYMEPDSFRVKMKTENLYEQDKTDPLSPEYYYTYGRRLMQLPKWSKSETDSLLIQYLALDVKMASDSDTTVILPEYLERALSYACALLAALRNNLDDAAWHLRMFETGYATTREGELKK